SQAVKNRVPAVTLFIPSNPPRSLARSSRARAHCANSSFALLDLRREKKINDLCIRAPCPFPDTTHELGQKEASTVTLSIQSFVIRSQMLCNALNRTVPLPLAAPARGASRSAARLSRD